MRRHRVIAGVIALGALGVGTYYVIKHPSVLNHSSTARVGNFIDNIKQSQHQAQTKEEQAQAEGAIRAAIFDGKRGLIWKGKPAEIDCTGPNEVNAFFVTVNTSTLDLDKNEAILPRPFTAKNCKSLLMAAFANPSPTG